MLNLCAFLSFHFSFDGRIVAKLPFLPISWLHGISHRNLLGNDFTDCSFIFLYILCTMSIRQVGLITYMSQMTKGDKADIVFRMEGENNLHLT